MCIVGEPKTPDALRNASDQFFEWVRPAPPAEHSPRLCSKARGETGASTRRSGQAGASKLVVKRRPRFLVEAVALLASDTSEGKAGLGALFNTSSAPIRPSTDLRGTWVVEHGQDARPAGAQQEPGGHWSVSLQPKTESAPETEAPRV